MADGTQEMPELDTTVPQTARVPVTRWRPEPGAESVPDIDQYCAVGRKP